MLEALTTAFVDLMAVQHLLYMMLGILVGLAVGILPGLGGIAGMSLLIPFIYGMDQVSALAMLVGMVAVIPTGDTFTSVLMGIPGSSASQATILDGFPLAKKGQAARALSAAFSASLLGGVFGAILLTGFVVIAKPLILAFGTAELFMLAVLGLSVVGVLAGNSVARGIAACGLGLLFGAIGAAPATGETRFDLEITYLQDGIPLVIIGLGLFAIPEIVGPDAAQPADRVGQQARRRLAAGRARYVSRTGSSCCAARRWAPSSAPSRGSAAASSIGSPTATWCRRPGTRASSARATCAA